MTEQLDMFNNEGHFLARMRNNWNKVIEADGGYCPCCGKWGKVYKMKLSQHLALSLRWIALHGEQDGWIESQSHRSGVWRATQTGMLFIAGEITAPSAVHIYDNRKWGVEEEQTTFRGCFGKHFDFEEMMSDQFNWAVIKKPEKND